MLPRVLLVLAPAAVGWSTAATNGWHGPIDVTYGDKDCPNVGCHGPWKGVTGPAVCEGICDGLKG